MRHRILKSIAWIPIEITEFRQKFDSCENNHTLMLALYRVTIQTNEIVTILQSGNLM